MSITKRLIFINILICITFIIFGQIVFFSFNNVQKVLTTLFSAETSRIIENSNMTREISRILSEMNFVLSSFYGKDDVLENNGKHIIKGIDLLIPQYENNASKNVLHSFKEQIQAIFNQCHKVNAIRQQIEITENNFNSRLNSLDNVVARRLIELIIKNEDAIDTEQISSLIGGYRSSFARIQLRFSTLGLEHFRAPMQGQEHPLIAGLDDLHLRLRTLTASTPLISEHGKLLIKLIEKYKELVPKFHQVSAELQIMLEKIAGEREKLLLIMEKTDLEIAKKTEESTLALNELINNTLKFNLFILLGILPVVIWGGVTAYSIKKPVQNVITYIDRLSKGDTPEKIYEKYKGEFNQVRDNLNILIEATSNVTKIAEEIASGNLNVLVRNRSENDRLMLALNSMILSLAKLQKETDNMICAVGAGKLDICGNADAFQGGWRTLVNGFNELIKDLSASVATSISLSNKMELARRIQTSLLPQSLENINNELEIAAEMITAERVGGDYYDISNDRRKNLWISIGDVSGHGVTPGLIMMMAQTIHTSVTDLTDCDPKNAIIKTNEILYKNVHERLKETHFMTFMTMKYMGKGRFQHSGAHLSMILFRRKTNECELIKTRGIYLNLIKDISCAVENTEFCLDPGDSVILYTDGLTEAQNKEGKILDLNGLMKIVKKHAFYDPDIMKNKIMEDVISWCDNHRLDDMAVVIVKRKQEHG